MVFLFCPVKQDASWVRTLKLIAGKKVAKKNEAVLNSLSKVAALLEFFNFVATVERSVSPHIHVLRLSRESWRAVCPKQTA